MSKRFGRNQKRRMRAKIVSLEQQNEREKSLSAYYASESRNFKAMLDDLIDDFKIWWDNCILTKPEIIEIAYDTFPLFYKVSSETRRSFAKKNRLTPIALYGELTFQTLEAVDIIKEKNIEEKYQHIILRIGDKVVKSYVNPNMFEKFEKIPTVIRKDLTEKILRKFEECYCKKKEQTPWTKSPSLKS